MADTMKFEFVSPERLVMSDEVYQVVVPGSEGEFAVLPGHAPFLSTMRPGTLSVQREAGGAEEKYFVRGGFADVTTSGLTILAEEAIDEATLDKSMLEQAIEDAAEDVADAKDDVSRARAQETLDRLREVAAEL